MRREPSTADKAITQLRDSVQGLSRNTSTSLSPADIEVFAKTSGYAGAGGENHHRRQGGPACAEAAALRDAVIRVCHSARNSRKRRALGADEKHLAPLAPFAANGLPDRGNSGPGTERADSSLVKASGAQSPGGDFLDRLQANASKLVRIRPLGVPAGDDTSAVLARIEVETAHADIDGALADLGKLDAENARARARLDRQGAATASGNNSGSPIRRRDHARARQAMRLRMIRIVLFLTSVLVVAWRICLGC